MAFPTFPNEMLNLNHLSPSGAGRAIVNQGCRFRMLAESWINQFHPDSNPDGIQKMLPDAGANVLGSIIHHVLERADPNSDAVNGVWLGARQEWDRRVELWEQQLVEQPMNAHMGGLPRIKNYRKTRRSVCLKANRIRLASIAEHSADSETQFEMSRDKQIEGYRDRRLNGAEVRVRNRQIEPTVQGTIDVINWGERGYQIIDWKTGRFQENDEMSVEYRVQLQLYAALFMRKQIDLGFEPIYPISIGIENPVTNVRLDLPVEYMESDACEDILQQAEQIYGEMSDIVEENPLTEVLLENQEFTVPDVDGCRYCRVRPACVPYRENLAHWMLDIDAESEEFGFEDVIGELVVLQPDGYGKATLIVMDNAGRHWRISGIELEAERNQNGLQGIGEGDQIAIFNIRHNPTPILPEYMHGKVNQRTHIIYNGN